MERRNGEGGGRGEEGGLGGGEGRGGNGKEGMEDITNWNYPNDILLVAGDLILWICQGMKRALQHKGQSSSGTPHCPAAAPA